MWDKLASQISNARKMGANITREAYELAFKLQGGACAICGNPQEHYNRALHIDHDHLTGVFRGILCQSCNSGLGKFRDRPDLLRKAAEYLEQGVASLH